jgi:ATP-dependent Zn protease
MLKKTVAIHEAAHAAICLISGIKFKKVTIIEKDDTGGHVALESNHWKKLEAKILASNQTQQNKIAEFVICCLAGYVAELKINSKHASDHASKDFEYTYTICTQLFANIKTVNSYINYMVCETENYFTYNIDEENNLTEDTPLWQFVILLSNELLTRKTLSYKECKDFFNKFNDTI